MREKCPNMEFFWSVFSAFVLNTTDTSYLSVFSSNAGKYEPQKTPYLNTFHAVKVVISLLSTRYLRYYKIINILEKNRGMAAAIY